MSLDPSGSSSIGDGSSRLFSSVAALVAVAIFSSVSVKSMLGVTFFGGFLLLYCRLFRLFLRLFLIYRICV